MPSGASAEIHQPRKNGRFLSVTVVNDHLVKCHRHEECCALAGKKKK